MDKVKLLGTNADASLSFSLRWFLLVLITFSSKFVIYFLCVFHNISHVLISVQTGSDDTAMNETCKSDVILCKAIQEVPDLK